MGVNITTIVYLGVLIIQIGSTIVLMVVEAQGICTLMFPKASEDIFDVGTFLNGADQLHPDTSFGVPTGHVFFGKNPVLHGSWIPWQCCENSGISF